MSGGTKKYILTEKLLLLKLNYLQNVNEHWTLHDYLLYFEMCNFILFREQYLCVHYKIKSMIFKYVQYSDTTDLTKYINTGETQNIPNCKWGDSMDGVKEFLQSSAKQLPGLVPFFFGWHFIQISSVERWCAVEKEKYSIISDV